MTTASWLQLIVFAALLIGLTPVLGGYMVDGLHWGVPAMFTVSAVLSVGTAVLVAFGSREVRPDVIPTGRSLTLAFGALRGVLGDRPTRRIFGIFFIAFLANQLTRPYIPVLVAHVNGQVGEASAIGIVAGGAGLVGALFGPFGGVLGDRIGYRWVLVGALGGSGVAALLMPFAAALPILALVTLALSGMYAVVAPMVFALLGTEVGPERRSQTLNLVYLPLYLGGIVGPVVASQVVRIDLTAPFVVAALVFGAGSLAVGIQARRGGGAVATSSSLSDLEAEGIAGTQIG